MPVGNVSTTQLTTTTTIAPIDPRLVDDCVEYVMFGAYTKNPLLTAMWDAADQNAGTLRDNCESLGLTDPAGLQALSDGLASLEVMLDNTTTTSTSPPRANRPTTTTTEPPVEPPITEAPPVVTEPCPPGTQINDAGQCEPDPVDTAAATTTVPV
jgi:hypothetical protein